MGKRLGIVLWKTALSIESHEALALRSLRSRTRWNGGRPEESAKTGPSIKIED